MATQRAGKGSSEQEKNGSVVGNGDTEGSAQKIRQAKKMKLLKEQQQQSTRLRWALLVFLLLVAVAGCYYYFWHYQTTSLPQQRTKHQVDSPQSQAKPPRGDKSKEKPPRGDKGKEKPPRGDKSKEKTKSKEKATSKKQSSKKQSSQSDKSKKVRETSDEEKEMERQRIEKLKIRVLRQPITGGDPDRPHILDIVTADNLLVDGKYEEALERFNAILSRFPQSPRAQFGKGITLSHMAKEKNSHKLMDTAIEFFRLAGDSVLGGEALRVAALIALTDHAKGRGKNELAVSAAEKLVELRSEEVDYINQLGVLYTAQRNMKKAKAAFKKSVKKFKSYFAKAQLGFILYSEKSYEKALPLMMDGIRHDKEIHTSARFYNYAGDILTKLNRSKEAFAVYGEAVALGLFPSVWQRSLTNEPGLKALPWWTVDATGYMTDFKRIEKAMDVITSEALGVFNAEEVVFTRDGGPETTPHYVLFSKGKKDLKNCLRTPKTCALLETIPEAAGCKVGTIKFSGMPPQTHISPHVGVTNSKLQVLVGLQLDSKRGIRIRVANETKILGSGQIGVIDESFEKEIWYAGEEPAVLLTMDVWHPDRNILSW